MKKGNYDTVTSLLLGVISIVSIIYDKTFAFNPFVLVVLYFSFYKGIKTYIINSLIMCFMSFVIRREYFFEIGVVCLTFLFVTCLFSYLFKDPRKRLCSIFTMNLLFLLSTVMIDFSIEALIEIVINTFLQIVIIVSIEDFIKSIYDSNFKCSPIKKAIVITSIALLGTWSNFSGILLIKIVLLIMAIKEKNEIGLLSVCFTLFYCIIFLNYSLILLVSLFLPIFLCFVCKKNEEIIFLISSTITIFFFNMSFYINASFYANFVAFLALKMILKLNFDWVNKYLSPSNNSLAVKERKLLSYSSGQIEALSNYISLVDEIKEENKNPFEDAISGIKGEVCQQCDHVQYCRVKQQLEEIFDQKISSKNKKMINEKCINPYKLTLAIESYFKVYDSERNYLSKIERANERYKYFLKAIETPLTNVKNQFKNNGETPLETKIKNAGLNFYDFYYKNGDLIVKFEFDDYEKKIDNFKQFLMSQSKDEYEVIIKSQNILTSLITVIFKVKPTFDYDIGILSTPLSPPFNGDNYFVLKKDRDLFVCLSDGMGHGECAQNSSKFLLKSIETHLSLQTSFDDMVKDLNNMLLSKKEGDNYSTLDLLKINLSSLKATFIKAGAFLTYVIRNSNIFVFEKHCLPLGIVNNCTFDTNHFTLMKDDIVIMVSDGLGERIEEDRKVLLIEENGNMNDFAKNIYKFLTSNCQIKDDSTIITIKIL